VSLTHWIPVITGIFVGFFFFLPLDSEPMHSKAAYVTINSSSSLEAAEVLIYITTHSRKTFISKCLSYTIVIAGKLNDSFTKIDVSHI
jgi:hypothetical protein